MPIKDKKDDLRSLLRELLQSDRLIEGRDERVPEIPNLREDEGIDMEVMFDKEPQFGIARSAPRQPVQQISEQSPLVTSFNIETKKRELLAIIDELIAHYVASRDYSEVSRLTTFAAGTHAEEAPSSAQSKSRYNTPVTLTTLLREKSPELLRPRVDVEVPPTPTWYEEFEKIMTQRQNYLAEQERIRQPKATSKPAKPKKKKPKKR